MNDIGDNRKVKFEVGGKGIATTVFNAVTHEFVSVPMPTENPGFESQVVYGSQPVVSVQPSQVIRGKITDADSGDPIEGLKLSFFSLMAFSNGTMDCVTNAEGRYEFDGIARPGDSKNARSFNISPGPDQPYFFTRQKVPVRNNMEAINLDIELASCKFISGRFVDQKTRKPMRGNVMYYPLLSNENAKKYPRFDPNVVSVNFSDAAEADDDGRFTLKVIDGDGILAAKANGGRAYQVAAGGKEAGVNFDFGSKNKIAYLFPNATHFNRIATFNLATQTDPIELEFVPRESKTLQVVTRSGEPVTEFGTRGRFPKASATGGWSRIDDGTREDHVTIFGLEEDKKRELLIWSSDKTHGTTTTITEETKSPIELQPTGVVRGTIKDFEGNFKTAIREHCDCRKEPTQRLGSFSNDLL